MTTEYRNFVRAVAAQKDGRTLLSRQIENARILVEAIFDDAESSVSIIDDGAESLYDAPGVTEAALRFLKRSSEGRISILVNSQQASVNVLAEAVRKAGFADRIETVEPNYLGFNMILSDDGSYRFRLGKSDIKGISDAEAFAQFGKRELSESLRQAFSHFRDEAQNPNPSV